MDINWIIAQLAPMLVRYGVFGICAVLAYLGFTEDQVAGMNGQITAAVSGFVGLAVLVIAGKLKPSVKAAQVAKQVDKSTADGTDVVLKEVATGRSLEVVAGKPTAGA